MTDYTATNPQGGGYGSNYGANGYEYGSRHLPSQTQYPQSNIVPERAQFLKSKVQELK